MACYQATVRSRHYHFATLREVLAKSSPPRSADQLAGVAAVDQVERLAAMRCLADIPLQHFLEYPVIAYEDDEVTRLIHAQHSVNAMSPVRSMTVGALRHWLLEESTQGPELTAVADGLTPEMVAAVSKLMRNQELVAVAQKCRVVTRFRTTVGLPGRLATRLQPNHPQDDPKGICISILDGLLLGSGDAVIGINPVTESVPKLCQLLQLLDELRQYYQIPTQNCVLAHVTQQLQAIEKGAPLDLMFQSIAGSEKANRGFGCDLKLLREAQEATLALGRNPNGGAVMYFETGQGAALSADGAFGVDAQTMEARAYAVARQFNPFLVNTVVGFIGPEYLSGGKQIIRAGLEDHFCGKVLGLPMGCDVCYTMHSGADQDDMDSLLTALGVAGCSYIMGIPGADDVMLNYQSTSFHDALYLRQTQGLLPAPEFQQWLEDQGLWDRESRCLRPPDQQVQALAPGRGPAPSTESLAPVNGEASSPVVASVPLGLQTSNALAVGFETAQWRQHTSARVALGRHGSAIPIKASLAMLEAQALAQDTLWRSWHAEQTLVQLAAANFAPFLAPSACASREQYMTRPDLGRQLAADAKLQLAEWSRVRGEDGLHRHLSFCITNGLSTDAIDSHLLPFLAHLQPLLHELAFMDHRPIPAILVPEGRVAVGDDVGHVLASTITVMVVGERPGCSAHDSLGIYLTYGPEPGLPDSRRHCISNVREPEGLSYRDAAEQLVELMQRTFVLQTSGVGLKLHGGSVLGDGLT